MKKLLNTLYITSPDAYLKLDGETVLIVREEQEPQRVPLLNLMAIVSFGYRGISPALMGYCAWNRTVLSESAWQIPRADQWIGARKCPSAGDTDDSFCKPG